MNAIDTTLEKINVLDLWTQKAVLGALVYVANASFINSVIRLVPNVPDVATVDSREKFERDLEAATKDAIGNDEIRAMAQLCNTLITCGHAVGLWGERELGGMEGSLAFMAGNEPSKEASRAEWVRRLRANTNPGPMAEFVQTDYAENMRRHVSLKTKGEYALKIFSTCLYEDEFVLGCPTSFDCLPETTAERLETKLIEKLHDRYAKISYRASNFRLPKKARDEMTADLLVIASLLDEYGEHVEQSSAPTTFSADEVAAMKQYGFAASPDAQDPKAPGSVTITRYVQ